MHDPSPSAEAANELQAGRDAFHSFPNQPASPATRESNDDPLARLLGGAPQPQTQAAPQPSDAGLKRMIQNIVAPSVVAPASAQESALLSAVDLELANQLRSILRHPDFQNLEAAWRGLDLLVRNFGAEENLKIYLTDISKQELAADLQTAESLETSGLYKLITRQADEQPWTLWLGQY